MNNIRLFAWILLATFVCVVGCATQKPTPNPLASWKMCWSQDPGKFDEAIKKDYYNYIENLSIGKRSFLGSTFFFEDGLGQHAVEIKVGVNGTWWHHVLIYDQSNKRIKAVKYKNGGYRS